MIDRIIEFSIRNRGLVILSGLALAVWGVYAVYHTPMDAIPDLSENQVIVFTEWTGHSPQEIEDQVTYPLALDLQGIGGVKVLRSSSDFNFSTISVIFEDSVDYPAARRELAERLSGAGKTLPPGVVPSLAPDAAATGQIFWYTVEGPGYDLGRLRAIQDWYVRKQLNSVSGVAEVASVGGLPIEYQVDVDPRRLQAFGVTLPAVVRAVARANAAVGGQVIQQGNAEFLVRAVGWLGLSAGGSAVTFDARQAIRDLENVIVSTADGRTLRLAEIARVAVGTQFRRGVLEKDGSEAVGGVVLMRYGENVLEVTRRIKEKVQELQVGLPPGVRIVPFYDRTPLIKGAVQTVAGNLVEAIITATICVILVLLHFRTSLIIAATLPLATLGSFAIMWTLRHLGIADIQTNIMSLAGLAISIGVLVDSSIVMAENAMFCLKNEFGDRPVAGDIRASVLRACRTVGRPIFFSILIMLLSFLPVFALGGMEGKMFRPLAFTKSFALVVVAFLSITLVPALCTFFIKGRLRRETESWLVRSVIQVYRPVLNHLLERPAALGWILAVTFLVGLAPLGSHTIFLGILFLGIISSWLLTRTWAGTAAFSGSLILIALIAAVSIEPLGHEFMTPLDEGMIMDMPITVPRASVTQSGDDLKARDMMFCRFPEVDMVVGKAGRAETATDPAPLDMIETMINFRPQEFWPRRKLTAADAKRQAEAVLAALVQRGAAAPPATLAARSSLVNDAVVAALPVFDAQVREFVYQKHLDFERELGPELVRYAVAQCAALMAAQGSVSQDLSAGDITRLSDAVPRVLAERFAKGPELEDVSQLARASARRMQESGLVSDDGNLLQYRPNWLMRGIIGVQGALGGTPPTFFTHIQAILATRYRSSWTQHVRQLDGELLNRAAPLFTRLILEEILDRVTVTDARVEAALRERKHVRSLIANSPVRRSGGHHHGASPGVPSPTLDPQPALDEIESETSGQFARWLMLWRKDRADLAGFEGELDRTMQMPGWTNVWTMPIQNRVDMLATGVNTAIGIRVLGRRLEDVVRASEEIAAVVKRIPGAADVVADPVRGKAYLEIHPDREKAARLGISIGDINDVVEIAVGGKVVTQTMEGRERHPVRVRCPRSSRQSEESIGDLPVPVLHGPVQPESPMADAVAAGERAPGVIHQVPLAEVADVRRVEGPATIKSENGLLRNYVRLNVRGRSAVDFVEEARSAVASQLALPPGVYLEWTGQFEHEVHARQTLTLILPLVVGLIFLILWATYRDLADAVLMMLAVPGAIAGGVFMQWWLGYKFSVTVWVGYIACFGMATATGIIMLVYLREALAKAGGLERMTPEKLRQTVLQGAVHRLRPKLLTEATIVIGLAPMLWSTGIGAEVIRPMTAPVLGGILIADEVIDLLLPVLFYYVRLWRLQRMNREKWTRAEST